jgi:hypothetical protein
MRKALYKFLLVIPIYVIFLYGCEKKTVDMQTVQPLNNSTESYFSDPVTANDNTGELPILFVLNGLYGYLDRQLRVIVPPIYDRGFNYTDQGYTWVRYRGERYECLILDREGKIVFQEYTSGMNILYDDIITYVPNGERYYKVVKFRDNNIIANGLGSDTGFSNNDIIILVVFSEGQERGFIDSSGTRILPNLKIHRMSRGFREDRAVVVEGENWDIRIIDINGNFYGGLHFYRTGRNFSEGLLPAETKDGRTGYINRDGEFAFIVPIVADIPDYDESPLNATDFSGGYALIQTVSDPPIWRIINNLGEFVSGELSISQAGAFVDGLSRIRIDTGYSYINTRGEMIVTQMFDSADSFHRGYARIIYQGRDGIINTEGQIFWSDDLVMATE